MQRSPSTSSTSPPPTAAARPSIDETARNLVNFSGLSAIARYHHALDILPVRCEHSRSRASVDTSEPTPTKPGVRFSEIEEDDSEQQQQQEHVDVAYRNIGGWDQTHDRLLVTWRKQSCINLWLQMSSAYYFQHLNNWIVYPTILISAASSMGFLAESCPGEVVRYILASISIISACLTALSRQTRAAEKAQEYSIKAREYGTFIRNLNFLLTLDFRQRPDPRETLAKLRADFDRINETQMEPPLNIIRLYEKNHKSLESALYEDLRSESKFNMSNTSM